MARSTADIQADLDIFYAARRDATVASYGLNTGQGSQNVTRNLPEINKTIRLLEAELEQADSSTGGLTSGSFERY